jgi:hypothetical protein
MFQGQKQSAHTMINEKVGVYDERYISEQVVLIYRGSNCNMHCNHACEN